MTQDICRGCNALRGEPHAYTCHLTRTAAAPEFSPDTRKASNPKDGLGSRKTPLSCVPVRVLWRVGLAMLEGAAKYGRFNFRGAGVRASVYFDAVVARHLFSWWEGEDIDPDSDLHHIDKAIAGLMVLRDSMLQGNWTDDRPPRKPFDMSAMNAHAAALIDKHADKTPKHWTIHDEMEHVAK